MPRYSYKARSRGGKSSVGYIDAASKDKAKNALYNKGLVPQRIVRVEEEELEGEPKGLARYIYRDEGGQIQIRLGSGLPSEKELALFTKQLSIMIENGIDIISALRLLKNGQKKPDFATMIGKISVSVEKGSSFSEALEVYPKTFNDLYVSMIRAGEKSGQLDKIMRQLVLYIEKAVKIKSQVKSAMTYPVMIVVVAVGVITLLLVFVVPTFAKQFEGSGQELPGLTQIVLNMSDSLIFYKLEILGGLVALFFGFRAWVKTQSGRAIFDAALLKAPILGDVMTKIAIGRFSSTLSTMLISGVAILDALQICASASGNKIIENFVQSVKAEIERGGNFYTPLDRSPLFPPLVSSMVEVGENTGKLDETLLKISEIYEDEVDTAIEVMTSMIEPIMIVVIGAIVGVIVLAMYLPIFDMASTI